MGLVHPGTPPELTLFLKTALDLNCFVETGTFQGHTAEWAAGRFKQVYTIELSAELHRRAALRLQGHGNLTLLQGDSTTHLASLAETLAEPALFWLDAHWSLGETAGEDNPCPLAQELEIILASPAPHVILVDDARLFCSPPALPHPASAWPSLASLARQLDKLGRPKFFLFEDVFIVPPPRRAALLGKYLQLEDTRHSQSPLRAPRPLPGAAIPLLKTCETALACGQADESLSLAGRGMADYPGCSEFASARGRALLAAGDAQGGLSFLLQACREAPTEFRYHADAAQALSLMGRASEAREEAEWAFAADAEAAAGQGLRPLLG